MMLEPGAFGHGEHDGDAEPKAPGAGQGRQGVGHGADEEQLPASPGGQKEAHAFIDHLEIFSLLANVADVKSLVIHPATTTHSQLSDAELEAAGIHQNTIRLSIGTEHIDDIIADLEKGFAAV